MLSKTGKRIATKVQQGAGPTVVYLHGFYSTMENSGDFGLAKWAAQTNRNFVRLDYSGHGQSEGTFEDGCLSEWKDDVIQVIEKVVQEPCVLVGYSMGGWISNLILRERPELVCGHVGIAVANGFINSDLWASLSDAQKHTLMEEGIVSFSEEEDMPSYLTRRFFDDAQVLIDRETRVQTDIPIRLIHGLEDEVVANSVPIRLVEEILSGPDIRLLMLSQVQHAFSNTFCVDLITSQVEEVIASIDTSSKKT